jgi:ketosteroid isomerase-like protein
MSSDRIGVLRAVFSEWAKGNFHAGSVLLAPDVVSKWGEPPQGDVVCHGPREVAERFGEFLGTWSEFRVEAEEFVELDDDHVMVVATQRGKGAQSGVETEMRVHIIWTFAGEKVVGTYWFKDREKALQLAGLSDPQ